MTQVEKQLAITKLVKRMVQLTQELELASMDMKAYAVPLSKGQFPSSWAKEVNRAFESYATEARRIAEAYAELFKEDIEAPEEPKQEIKKRKRK